MIFEHEGFGVVIMFLAYFVVVVPLVFVSDWIDKLQSKWQKRRKNND